MRTSARVTARKKQVFFNTFETGKNVSVRQAAKTAKISVPTAYTWIRQGRQATTTSAPKTKNTTTNTTRNNVENTVLEMIELHETTIKGLKALITLATKFRNS